MSLDLPPKEDPIALHCFHILSSLPENYDRHRLPGYVDDTDGQSLSCGVSFESGTKRKCIENKSSKNNKKLKNMKLDVYFKKSHTSDTASTSNDVVDNPKTSSPWKLAVCHTGTKNCHWHFIYISSHAQYGSQSKLGRDIFNTRNKVQKIRCIQCLYNYLHSGNGREVIVNNMSNEYKYLISCEKHLKEANDNLLFYSNENDYEEDELLRSLVSSVSVTQSIYYTNNELLQIFLENCAFNESSARLALSKTIQGRNYLFKPKSQDTIKVAIQTAKLIVFQETPMERLQRSKIYHEKIYGKLNYLEELDKLYLWLRRNKIDQNDFADITNKNFFRKSGKKNNLFFKGPPSTGKSMIMQSLLFCHFNYTRLTGLIESSPFNFASLIYCNACFMDEIKITDNHFEQWKLIAGGQQCTTDVKYQDKCDINNCVLYTASNYEIDLFCTVPQAKEAIEERTYMFEIKSPCEEYFCPAPQTWEMFWEKYL